MAVDFGVEVPEHTILGHLGQGGMARVFLARDEAIGRLVAVKVIDARFDTNDQFLRRFEREAKTAGGFSHPNIVPIHRFGLTTDGRPYLTMAYLAGGSLRDRLRRQTAMAIDEALGVMRQVAGALQAAHSRQIVHRDLKPDNILFQGESAFLTDFGIAKLLDSTIELTGVGASPGTVRYFSPEQAQDLPLDARSDIYSLGVLLYEMVTGKSPIAADSVPTLMMRIAFNAPDVLPASLLGLQPFMDVLLAKEPAGRLASCTEVISAIDGMMRNWMRFENLDRLTEGVSLQPSGTAAAKMDLDDTINVFVVGSAQVSPGRGERFVDPMDRQAAIHESANPIRPAFGPAKTSRWTDADNTSGLSELGRMTEELIAAEPRPVRSGYRRIIGTGAPRTNERLPMGRRMSPVLIGLGALIVVALVSVFWIADAPNRAASNANGGRGNASIVNLPEARVREAMGPVSRDMGASLRSATRVPSGALERGTMPAPGGELPAPDARLRSRLLGRIDGRWTFDTCANAISFSTNSDRLLQYWPQFGLAEEKIVGTDALSVTTEVITPAEQAGKHFRYSPGKETMRIEDIAGNRGETLTRCK